MAAQEAALSPSPRRDGGRLFVNAASIIMTVPILLLLCIFFIVPLTYMFRISLAADKMEVVSSGMGGSYTFVQYLNLLVDHYFYEMLVNSFQVGLFTTLITLVLAYPVAWYLANCRGWERTILASICLLPLFVSIVVTVFGWSIILLPFGALQQVLSALGLVQGPLRWTGGVFAMSIVLAYECLPYAILILVASIQAIRPDKIDAARLLGAGPVRIFLTVAMPLSMPGIIASAVLVFSIAISSYLVPALISGSRTVVLPLQIFSTIAEVMDWPRGAAMSTYLLILVFGVTYAFTVLASRLTRRGEWSMV